MNKKHKMLSTSFIVARQPAKPRQESSTRKFVNSPPNTAEHGQETNRGRETVSQTRERRHAKTDRALSKTRDTSQTRETSIKKLVRSVSMSKTRGTISWRQEASDAKTEISVSQTRDPQQRRSQPTWENDYQERRNDSFINVTISENDEGSTKCDYPQGTIGRDDDNQGRPWLEHRTAEMGKRKEDTSYYENIDR